MKLLNLLILSLFLPRVISGEITIGLAISDWVVVMKEGRIIERGTPTQIYRAPRHSDDAWARVQGHV